MDRVKFFKRDNIKKNMIIVISGSVGSGKTTISNLLKEELNADIIHLNEWAEEFKIEKREDLQTFDFDIDKLLDKIENHIKKHEKKIKKTLIIESHFAHFINKKLVGYLFILNRDLKDLKIEYIKRQYNEEKIKENLEVETLNLCFYEALENGYEEDGGKIFCIENSGSEKATIKEIKKKIK